MGVRVCGALGGGAHCLGDIALCVGPCRRSGGLCASRRWARGLADCGGWACAGRRASAAASVVLPRRCVLCGVLRRGVLRGRPIPIARQPCTPHCVQPACVRTPLAACGASVCCAVLAGRDLTSSPPPTPPRPREGRGAKQEVRQERGQPQGTAKRRTGAAARPAILRAGDRSWFALLLTVFRFCDLFFREGHWRGAAPAHRRPLYVLWEAVGRAGRTTLAAGARCSKDLFSPRNLILSPLPLPHSPPPPPLPLVIVKASSGPRYVVGCRRQVCRRADAVLVIIGAKLCSR